MALKIVGVYSFPKSGNTWVRHIIGRALGVGDVYKSIPDIYTDTIWDNPVTVGDTPTVFYKSHSANEATSAYGRNFSNDLVIYIVRHPLDVFLSQLNHVSGNVSSNPYIMLECTSVDDVIRRGEIDLYFGAFCTFGTLTPGFADAGSWFTNCIGWKARAEAEPNRVLVVRYEDLAAEGPGALTGVSDMLGLTKAQLIDGFAAAQAQTRPDGKFFWKQKVANYRDMLPPGMVARFRSLYGDVMRRMGYGED